MVSRCLKISRDWFQIFLGMSDSIAPAWKNRSLSLDATAVLSCPFPAAEASCHCSGITCILQLFLWPLHTLVNVPNRNCYRFAFYYLHISNGAGPMLAKVFSELFLQLCVILVWLQVSLCVWFFLLPVSEVRSSYFRDTWKYCFKI